MLNIVRELAAEGMTMLLATHEMGFAQEVASKVCFLYDGVVCEEGPPEQIFEDPHEERTRTLPAAHHRSGPAVARALVARTSPSGIHQFTRLGEYHGAQHSTPARERRDRPTCLQPHCHEQRGR